MFSQPRAPPMAQPEGYNQQHYFNANSNANFNDMNNLRSSSSANSAYSNGNKSLQSNGSAISANNDRDMQRYHETFCQQLGVDPGAHGLSLKEGSNKAREKLLKLPMEQFSELATDVHDELQRRNSNHESRPVHLPPLDYLHPKRNQGREKLSILPPNRFNDLCTDILYGIETRYPNVLNDSSHEHQRMGSQSTTHSVESANATNTAITTPHIESDQQQQEFEDKRPVGQTLQQTTIIPTKGMLEEESDEDEEDEEFEEGDETLRIGDDSRASVLESIAEEEGKEDEMVQHSKIYSDRSSKRYSGQDLLGVQQQQKRDVAGQLTPPESSGFQREGYFEGGEERPITRSTNYTSSMNYSGNDQDLQDLIRDRDEQIEVLINEGSRMDETINKLESQLAESEEMKNTLVDENGRLHDVVGTLENDKEQNLAEIGHLKQSSETSAKGLDEQVTRYQDEIREAETKLAAAEAQVLELQTQHDEKVKKLEADLKEARDGHEQIRQKQVNNQADYDQEHSKLNQTISELRGAVTDHEMTIMNLKNEADSAASARSISSSTTNPEELQRKYDKLKKDHSKLNKELEQQQKVTEQVRAEAAAFLEEMRTLASNQSSWDSSQTLQSQLQDLRVEVQEWKSRYLRAKSQVRNARSSTYGTNANNRSIFQPSMSALEKSSPYYDEDFGMVKDTTVHQFQLAVEEFLIKSRTDVSNLLDHLHHLVVAARRVNQDITDGDSRGSDMVQSELAQCTSMVSTTANNLITTTRNHVTSGGIAPIAVLDAAVSDLSSAVIELVKVAKIRPQEGPLIPDEEDLPAPRPESNDYNNDNNQYNSSQENQTYSEAQPQLQPQLQSPIKENRESLLSDKRQSYINPETQRRSLLRENSSTSRDSQSRSSHHSQQEKQDKRRSVMSNTSNNNEVMSPTDAHESLESRRISVKNATATRKKRFASVQQESPGRFDAEDPDNTVAELQAYLEQKTLGVIDSIQNLLTGIRGNSKMGELRTHVTTIIEAVNRMIEATGSSMQQTRNKMLKDKGQYILGNLKDCTQRMVNLQTNSSHLDDGDAPNRNLKQRLAASSFDMTKCTEELVKTVEEVSLTAEIQDIDDQLLL